MASQTVYSFDSSALIHAWNRVYRPKNFAFVWNGFDALIEQSRMRSSIEVYNELEKKDDELFKWCKDRKEGMFVEIDDDVQAHVARIMKAYPRLVDTVKEKNSLERQKFLMFVWPKKLSALGWPILLKAKTGSHEVGPSMKLGSSSVAAITHS
jgi:hypothetical protein